MDVWGIWILEALSEEEVNWLTSGNARQFREHLRLLNMLLWLLSELMEETSA